MTSGGVGLNIVCVFAAGMMVALALESTHSQLDNGEGDYLHRLLHVLGIDHASQRLRHPTPPQYMLDLYKSVAGTGGVTQAPSPYHANVIRSYSDRDASTQFRFFFNVSANASKKDRILEAEFLLYKLKPRPRAKAKLKGLHSQLLEVKVYQIMHQGKKKHNDHRLLDVRRLSIHSTGWEKFYVREAVEDWLQNNVTNLGLLITVRSLQDEPVPMGLVRFAKRHHHHVNRHPLLVLFFDDGRHLNKRHYSRNDFHDYGFQDHSGIEPRKVSGTYSFIKKSEKSINSALEPPHLPETLRTKRSKDHEDAVLRDSDGQSQSCTRHELYVDFEKIGWSAWIISPKGYNAFYCKGDCAFPLGQNQWPTNHATVQSIVHELNLSPGVNTPCCVPNKLFAISLLYFDEHENVILKQYDDMVAASCGCH